MKRSWTAQGAAAQRALLTRIDVVDDAMATSMLTPGLRWTTAVLGHAPHALFARAVTLAGAAGTCRWFDAQVVGALDDGIDQVAVLGAGYDSRAWRLGREGVRFFELDHAASQAAKRSAMPVS